jgi:hypothetical protein
VSKMAGIEMKIKASVCVGARARVWGRGGEVLNLSRSKNSQTVRPGARVPVVFPFTSRQIKIRLLKCCNFIAL